MPKLALHEEPITSAWREDGVHWHAYSLPPRQTRPHQRDERLATLPADAILCLPSQVALWIERQYAVHAPYSQPLRWLSTLEREELQIRCDYRQRTNAIVATRGDSLYIDIKRYGRFPARSAPLVRQLWVEAVREEDCPVANHDGPPTPREEV